MKSTNETLELMKIQDSTFFKNSYIYPFLYTYITNKNVCKIKTPFKLLHNYVFGEDCNNQIYGYRRTDVFVGYRWLDRKFLPVFISVSKYEEKDNKFVYHINGFSTYDNERPWYNKYNDLGFVEDLPVIIEEDNYYVPGSKMLPLYKQIKVMGEKVLKHFEIRQKHYLGESHEKQI